MSIFAQTTPAPRPKSEAVKQIATLYAILLVIMAVCQLFTFETFLTLIPSFNLPLGGLWPYVLGPLVVAAEVFALPFLLRMPLSIAFRALSMALGWIAAGIWLFVSLWVVGTAQPVDTIGFIGTLAPLTPGWWAVCMALALAVLAAWSSWGMWPGKGRKK